MIQPQRKAPCRRPQPPNGPRMIPHCAPSVQAPWKTKMTAARAKAGNTGTLIHNVAAIGAGQTPDGRAPVAAKPTRSKCSPAPPATSSAGRPSPGPELSRDCCGRTDAPRIDRLIASSNLDRWYRARTSDLPDCRADAFQLSELRLHTSAVGDLAESTTIESGPPWSPAVCVRVRGGQRHGLT